MCIRSRKVNSSRVQECIFEEQQCLLLESQSTDKKCALEEKQQALAWWKQARAEHACQIEKDRKPIRDLSSLSGLLAEEQVELQASVLLYHWNMKGRTKELKEKRVCTEYKVIDNEMNLL